MQMKTMPSWCNPEAATLSEAVLPMTMLSHHPDPDRSPALSKGPKPVRSMLADLIDDIAADTALSQTRRRDLVSSIRSFGRAVDRDPSMIPADTTALRALIRNAHPANAGILPKRWANIRSDVTAAVKRLHPGSTKQWQASQLDGAWKVLRDAMPDPWERIRLSRLFHYLVLHGIEPEDVTTETFDAFRVWLGETTLTRNPDLVFRQTCAYWNRAMAAVPAWPQVQAPEHGRDDIYAQPIESFPASFGSELASWKAVVEGDDLLDQRAPARPLRPATVDHMTRTLMRFASGLVHADVPIEQLAGLADLVQPERFKTGLRWQLERRGGKPTPGLNQMADVLITIARMWVQVDKATLDGLRLLARRIDVRGRGLTQSNRERLRQFDDPRNVARLLALPEHLCDLARKQPVAQPAALQMQTSLAIAILLAAPIRLRNLAGLRLGESIVRTGNGAAQAVRLVIEGDQTKNREPLDYPLPVETARLMDLYLATYRPLLLRGADDGALFPGRGGAKDKNLLGQQIQKAVRSRTGLVVHTHLFRHLAGKLSLMVDPGNFEQVRRLLGHRSIDTTTMFYTGFATDAAARRYHEQVLRPEPVAPGSSRS